MLNKVVYNGVEIKDGPNGCRIVLDITAFGEKRKRILDMIADMKILGAMDEMMKSDGGSEEKE